MTSFYNMATIMCVKSFIIQAQGYILLPPPPSSKLAGKLSFHLKTTPNFCHYVANTETDQCYDQ
jgi:hypothetical protein